MNVRIFPAAHTDTLRATISTAAVTTWRLPKGYISRRLIIGNRNATAANSVIICPSLTRLINLTDADYALWSSIVAVRNATGATITPKDITGISAAAAAVVDCVGHGLDVGAKVRFAGVEGMTEINGLDGNVTIKNSVDQFTVDIDSSLFTPWSAGGKVYLKPDGQIGLWLYDGTYHHYIKGNNTTEIRTATMVIPGSSLKIVTKPDYKIFGKDTLDLPIATTGFQLQALTDNCDVNAFCECDKE